MGKRKGESKARRYEREKAKAHGAKHIGGPGKPDYKRGQTKGEVKNWSRPVDRGVVKHAKQKGVKEIDSKSGFTAPAEKEAKKHNIKLFKRGKRIT